MSRFSFLNNHRLVTILCLGFSSGLPLSLCASTLTAWYTVAGLNLLIIGWLSWVQLPYLLKPLWAPCLDRYAPVFLGRRLGWIFLSQVAIALILLWMACLSPQFHPVILAGVATLLAFASSTQDVAFDAYRTDVCPGNERGLAAAMVSCGYRLAMLVSGALALVFAAQWGFRFMYGVMAILMGGQCFVTYLAPSVKNDKPPKSLSDAIVRPVSELWSRPSVIWLLVFIVCYKLCDAFALSLSTTFLIRGVHFSLEVIGSTVKVVALVASLLGSILGGWWMSRHRLYHALLFFGVLQALSNVGYLALVYVGHVYWFMVIAIFIEYFCGGLSTIAFVALLMSLCHHRFSATQYALLSALSSVGRVVVGPLAAVVVRQYGWSIYFELSILLGFPALFLLWLKPGIVDYQPEVIALPRGV